MTAAQEEGPLTATSHQRWAPVPEQVATQPAPHGRRRVGCDADGDP